MNAIAKFDLSPRQLTLVKQTIAKDCNKDEFDLFCEVARGKGLDPFLGQIIPMVFSKGDAEKRKLTIIITRDGQRVIAQRCGDYRAASKPPTYEIDKDLVSETNPLGIVSATVYLWKQDPKSSQWHEVAGQAYWDEFAPIKQAPTGGYDYVDTGETWPDSGKPKRKKVAKGDIVLKLDDSGNWVRQPRVMISKCAEMQALRAGWPEEYNGLYGEEEMDRAKTLDLSASEIVEHDREETRMKAISGKDAITVTWGDGWTLENVPAGQFFDRAAEFVAKEPVATVRKWNDANRDPLRLYWAKHPGDAFELRKLIDAKIALPVRGDAADARNHVLNAG